MALQKTITMASGVSYNYHKAESPKINSSDKSGVAVVKFYIDSAARLAGKKELGNKVYKLPANTFSQLNLSQTDARDLVYLHLKTLPEFIGATNV